LCLTLFRKISLAHSLFVRMEKRDVIIFLNFFVENELWSIEFMTKRHYVLLETKKLNTFTQRTRCGAKYKRKLKNGYLN
jgi:hypothetical protein